MFNLLRMDLRRLFKTRSFYIVLAVTAVLLILVTVMVSAIADPEIVDAMEAQGAEITASDRVMSEYIQSMSQLELLHETLGSGFLLVMSGIGMTLFVNNDFSSGFIKNICASGQLRRSYVLSKVLLAGVYSGLLMVFSILLVQLSLLATHMYPVPEPAVQLAAYAFWMWLAHWAFCLMALTLVLLTRSTTLGLTLSLVSGSGLTAALTGGLCGLLTLPHLEPYLLSSVVKEFCAPHTGSVPMVAVCCAVWGLAYLSGSLLLMEKRDI